VEYKNYHFPTQSDKTVYAILRSENIKADQQSRDLFIWTVLS